MNLFAAGASTWLSRLGMLRNVIRQELVAACNIAGKGFTGGGQDKTAILFVVKQTLAIESLDHVGHAGL